MKIRVSTAIWDMTAHLKKRRAILVAYNVDKSPAVLPLLDSQEDVWPSLLTPSRFSQLHRRTEGSVRLCRLF